jgi:hypothetical protein
MVLCVFGIYFLVKEITSIFLKNTVKASIVLEIAASPNEVEGVVRSVMRANPKSEIIVYDRSGCEESRDILLKLCDECERLRVMR